MHVQTYCFASFDVLVAVAVVGAAQRMFYTLATAKNAISNRRTWKRALLHP